MSKNTVKHIVDIPDWFDLNNYRATETFSASEWATQLGIRRQIQWSLGRNNKSYIDEILSQFDAIKANPTTYRRPRKLPNVDGDIQHASTIVGPMTCGLARAIGSDITTTLGLDDGDSLGVVDRHSVSRFYKDNEFEIDHFTPIVIDLNCSDVDIKNAFCSYLKELRAFTGNENKKTHVTKSDVDKLHRYKILPYIDLLIWSSIEKRRIYAHVLIDTLFSDSESIQARGAPFIAETVRPFYDKVNGTFIRALHSFYDND
jgi:hypothetical protein